jgi:nucleoside-diphosphate-sugar epimerase
MRIFVTGGTGFIGSHFLRQALAAGHQVTALRRTGASPRVPLAVQPRWLERSFEGLTVEDLAGHDALVHLAAHSANVPYDTWESCLHWNATVPMRMLERAAAAEVPRFVFAGSCFEYGRSAVRYEFVPADAPLEPTQSYPASKAAASVAALAFAVERGLRFSLLRPFQVFGEGELATRFWPALRAAALAGKDFPMTAGEQVRDFVPVEQVAARFLAELADPPPAGEPRVANVGTGRPQTLRAFAEEWWGRFGATGRLLPGAVPYRANEVMRYVPEI